MTLAVHADWSVAGAKRWMTVAERRTRGWHVDAPCPVGDPRTLLGRLQARHGGRVALGVDFPLGLPRAYARDLAEPDFPAFLRGLADRPDFFLPCAELRDVSHARPFYPSRGLAGMTRTAHAQALGLDQASALSRQCDRATALRPAGAPLFWTLGANQTGKAAISAWRDLLLPALQGPNPPRLWPFDGDLLALLAAGRVVVAETYPAEAMRQVGVRLIGSKTRQADRAAACPAVRAAMNVSEAVAADDLLDAIETGFGPEYGADDGFDSLLGLLGLLGVLDGRQPDGIPPDPALRRWEGWVLGQTELPRTVHHAVASGCPRPLD